MPLALRDLQAAFAAHVTGGDRADLVAAVAGDTIPAAARLNVYRHHVFESLGAALAATFPTVQALVGTDFFRGLARAFIGHALPAQPVLTEYGADFPAFIAGYRSGARPAVPGRCRPARLGPEPRLPCAAGRSAEGGRPFRRAGGAPAVDVDRLGRGRRPGQLALSPGSHLGGLSTRCHERDSRSEFRRRQSPCIATARRCGVRQPECGRGRFRGGAGRGDVARAGCRSGVPGRSGL